MMTTPGIATAPTDAVRGAVIALLAELDGLLSAMTDDQYAQRPVGPIDSSIGGHVRHSLDHVESLLTHDPDHVLCYDHRDRGTAVETSRNVAIEKMATLRAGLRSMGRDDYPLTVKAMISTADSVTMPSTLVREMLFVFSHTLHHNGQIRAMALLLGITVPERFGYAPATLAFLDQGADQKPCAR